MAVEIRPLKSTAELGKVRTMLSRRCDGKELLEAFNLAGLYRKPENIHVAAENGEITGICVGGKGRFVYSPREGADILTPSEKGSKYYVFLVATARKGLTKESLAKKLVQSQFDRAASMGFKKVYGKCVDDRLLKFYEGMGLKKTRFSWMTKWFDEAHTLVYELPQGKKE